MVDPGSKLPNYTVSSTNGTLTVTRATLTVTAEDGSRVYGDANPTFTPSYSGFKNGENLGSSGVTGSPSLTTTAIAASSVAGSPYTITAALGTLASGNYSFSFVNGHLTVTKATLTVTAQDTSREYGDANPAFTAGYAGFKNGETLATSGVTGSPSLTTSATPASSVAGSPYTITAAAGTLAAGNYSFAFVTGNLTITKATLNVTADDKSRDYGVANPTFTASYAGFKNGETLGTSDVTGSPSLTTTATAASPVGTYAITAAVGSLSSGNYSFSFHDGTLTVSKATLTVTANNASRGYGDANPTLHRDVQRLQERRDAGHVGCDRLAEPDDDGDGDELRRGQPVHDHGSGRHAGSGNYNFAFVDGELTITKATLTVTADDKARVYGYANPTFTASYSGFKNGETLGTTGVTGSPSLTTLATATSPVAGSPYAITAALGTLAAGNYSFSFVNGDLTITKATLTVTADNASREYGDANPDLHRQLLGLQERRDAGDQWCHRFAEL